MIPQNFETHKIPPKPEIVENPEIGKVSQKQPFTIPSRKRGEQVYRQSAQNLSQNNLQQMKINFENLSLKVIKTIQQLVNSQQSQKNWISSEINNIQKELHNKMDKLKSQITLQIVKQIKQEEPIGKPVLLSSANQTKSLDDLLKRLDKLENRTAATEQKAKQIERNNNWQALWKIYQNQMNALSNNLNHRASYFQNQMAGCWGAQINQIKDQIYWLSHKIQTQIGNLNLQVKTISSNILEKMEKIKKVQGDDGRMAHLLQNTDIKSCEWVHQDSYFYEMLNFSDNTVSFNGSQQNKFTKAFVMGRQSVSQKFCFTIKVGKMHQRMAVGVISSTYLKTLQVFQNCNRWLFLFSDGSLMGDGNITNAIKKRDGFNENDIVKVSVDLRDNRIQWSINGRVECIFFWEKFKQSSAYYLPCVVLQRQSSFSIIQ